MIVLVCVFGAHVWCYPQNRYGGVVDSTNSIKYDGLGGGVESVGDVTGGRNFRSTSDEEFGAVGDVDDDGRVLDGKTFQSTSTSQYGGAEYAANSGKHGGRNSQSTSHRQFRGDIDVDNAGEGRVPYGETLQNTFPTQYSGAVDTANSDKYGGLRAEAGSVGSVTSGRNFQSTSDEEFGVVGDVDDEGRLPEGETLQSTPTSQYGDAEYTANSGKHGGSSDGVGRVGGVTAGTNYQSTSDGEFIGAGGVSGTGRVPYDKTLQSTSTSQYGASGGVLLGAGEKPIQSNLNSQHSGVRATGGIQNTSGGHFREDGSVGTIYGVPYTFQSSSSFNYDHTKAYDSTLPSRIDRIGDFGGRDVLFPYPGVVGVVLPDMDWTRCFGGRYGFRFGGRYGGGFQPNTFTFF